MRRYYLIALFCLLGLNLFAINRLVYFRYDIPVSNTTRLLEKLEQQASFDCERFVLFYNLETLEGREVSSLLGQKSFLNKTDVYEAKSDCSALSSLLQTSLGEYVDKGEIKGKNDSDWHIVIMIHEKSSVEEICKLIDVSELSKRYVNLSFVIYDDEANFRYPSYDEIISSGLQMLNF